LLIAASTLASRLGTSTNRIIEPEREEPLNDAPLLEACSAGAFQGDDRNICPARRRSETVLY